MHKVREVPSRQIAAREEMNIVGVIFAEELHSHHGEDEYDDAQYEGQVTQCTHRSTHDGNQ